MTLTEADRPAARNVPVWRQPVWLAGHVVALVAIVGFALLGFWQLGRHQDRSAADERISMRLGAPAADVAEVRTADIDDVEYLRVILTGMYDVSEEVVWRARTLNGVSGHHVITPLVLDDGTAVLVDRGWVPIEMPDPGTEEAAPQPGVVAVSGIIRRPQSTGGFGPRDPAEGELQRISRVIPARLAAQIEAPLVEHFYVQRSEPSPGDGELPRIGQLPEPGGGAPHLSYAVQWWVFAGIVIVGYPILLSRTERRRRARSASTL